MATQISINTDAATAIVGKVRTEIGTIEASMQTLNNEIQSLLSDGEWKGDACDKFFQVYDSVKDTFLKTVPEDLNTLNENINTNLGNLIEADATGAR